MWADRVTAGSYSAVVRLAIRVIIIILVVTSELYGQTSSTGALVGVVLDPSGAVIPSVVIDLINPRTAKIQSTATSDRGGRFGFLLLAPGSYELRTRKADFRPLQLTDIHISVTETLRLEVHLQLVTVVEQTDVSSAPAMVQTDNSALGRTLNTAAITGLPLVTRNFTQIASLSPGVVAGVYNASELGVGGAAQPQISSSYDGIFAHGSRSYANDWQLDGISVSDAQGSGSYSGGIPIPNPDAIAEFKVQTGLYDAAYGRYAGANVSVITKSGSNAYHGSVLEFFRNDVLNANLFFLNQTQQPRPPLKQNQFGFALGGPIQKDKIFFFGSYQGTRQVNGLAAGQARIACTATLISPPLTNDRSPAAIGVLFGGMSGALGGVPVQPDGSNINPAALALLNFRLADGTYLIPTPQTVDSSKPFAQQGFSAFTAPCHFDEDQFSTNVDYVASPKSKIAARFFLSNDHASVAFPGNGLNPMGNIPGFASPIDSDFRVFSLAHTYTLSSSWLNEARMGYVRTRGQTGAHTPFQWSSVGVDESQMNNENGLPSLNILGSISLASGLPRTFTQNSFVFSDILSVVHGPHSVRVGGSFTRLQDNTGIVGLGSLVQFLSWPDFLLGLDAVDNGTGTFSNVFTSLDAFGLFDREYRVWEASAFAQDDYRISKSLTLDIGLRYERMGQFGDRLGRNSSFDFQKADPNPPPEGSLDGFVVASNFSGAIPPGVARADNTFANNGAGQDTLAPRVGFAWRVMPTVSQFVLRGGYGLYYSRPTGQALALSVVGAPFGLTRQLVGAANATATFQAPFPTPYPTPESFPMFLPYSASTRSTITAIAPGLRPALIQQFSLNLQGEPHEGWLLEIGYVGAQGAHLQRDRSLNQALPASVDNPIRGVTSDTFLNVSSRTPILGIPADSLSVMETEGDSWYNGLETSLTKRFNHGLQFLASYTFSKTLDSDGANINGTSAGNALTRGDQNSPRQRWGRAGFDRTQRFVLSTTWTLPSPVRGGQRAILGGWALAAVATIQSGTALTITDTNSKNVFGISEDRAQLTGNCAKSQLVRGGSIQSKLNSYFNASCFTTPPVIGADGIGTGFGNSATGAVDGPGQANLDIALSKAVFVNWPHEQSSIEFRAEFYNALNHPQFGNPDTNFTSSTFGVISSTSVNARIGQLAMKFNF